MEAYPLAARPLPSGAGVAPVVDLRSHTESVAGLDALASLGPWPWSLEYARCVVAGSGGDDAAGAPDRLVDDDIKGFDTGCGGDRDQLGRVIAALDDGRPVAFYGWWPTAELAATTDILGVDAMEVPTPDRKGTGLFDGHAVVILGYGLHAAFPGGGYLIVRSPWGGWGHGGDGYLPFTYVRAYATALRSFRSAGVEMLADDEGHDDHQRPKVGEPIDRLIAERARCYDPRSSYTDLFFSENPMDIVRAKAICSKCTVRELCLRRALERSEPYGVWGGEFVLEGQVVAVKRGRGRPRKVPLPTIVDEVTGVPVGA